MTGLTPSWKKSTRSNGSDACVEARTQGESVEVRDTKDRSGPVLTFTSEAWTSFLKDVREGRYDLR